MDAQDEGALTQGERLAVQAILDRSQRWPAS